MRDIYQALYEFGADVVIAGHDHDYEQFHWQNSLIKTRFPSKPT